VSARVEAAAKAIHKHDALEGITTRYAPTEIHKAEAAAALAAADAFMFDNAAVERAAIILASSEGWDMNSFADEAARKAWLEKRYAGITRAMIAALKGDEA